MLPFICVYPLLFTMLPWVFFFQIRKGLLVLQLHPDPKKDPVDPTLSGLDLGSVLSFLLCRFGTWQRSKAPKRPKNDVAKKGTDCNNMTEIFEKPLGHSSIYLGS